MNSKRFSGPPTEPAYTAQLPSCMGTSRFSSEAQAASTAAGVPPWAANRSSRSERHTTFPSGKSGSSRRRADTTTVSTWSSSTGSPSRVRPSTRSPAGAPR